MARVEQRDRVSPARRLHSSLLTDARAMSARAMAIRPDRRLASKLVFRQRVDLAQALHWAASNNPRNSREEIMPTSNTRPARPVRPGVPPLPSFEALDQTHRQVMQTLGELAKLLDHLDAHGMDEVARTRASDICRFFDETARSHHVAEEQVVFPSLLADGDSELVQHVRRLQQDHGWLEEDWLELGPQLRAVAEGYNWYDLDVLRHAIPVFTALYRDHIALEETIVYPASRRRQTSAQTLRKQAK
jgi:hemerythrin-like domain-containing protein